MRSILALLFLTLGFSGFAIGQTPLQGPIQFFYSPLENAHQPIVDAIDNAKNSVHMTMFHLSDPVVGSSLMFAAKRGVDVRIIFDKTEWRSPNDSKMVDDMKAAGVNLVQASTGFNITHEKAMVIDNRIAMISTMNEVRTFMTMLDFGIFTTDADVVSEWNAVFEADWQNAAANTNTTPPLTNANLLWAPVNAVSKLTALVDSSSTTLVLFVENLAYNDIINALSSAAKRGVAVRVLVPECDVVRPGFNLPAVQTLRAAGVDARMLPGPATSDLPYIHAKSIVVDNSMTYIGSQNFTYNSLTQSREVGIILPDSEIANDVTGLFETLWPKADMPPADPNYKCSPFNTPSATPDIGGSAVQGAASAMQALMIQPLTH